MESCPQGYPRLAAFLDSDEGFSIYRRFGYVSSRLILGKQEEMQRLEKDLLDMDEEDRQANSKRLVSNRYPPRRDTLQKLEARYNEYGKPSSYGTHRRLECY